MKNSSFFSIGNALEKYMGVKLLLILILAVCLRYPDNFEPVHNVDEALWASGTAMLQKGAILYRDVWDSKPPLLYLIYRAVFSIFGTYNMIALHLMTNIWILATLITLFSVTKKLFDENTGYISALLYTVYSTAMAGESSMASNAETFMNLPLLLGILAFLAGMKSGKTSRYLLAGLLTSIGMLIKQPGGINIIVMLLALVPLFFNRSCEQTARRIFSMVGALLGGFLLPVFICTLYFYFHNALDDFIFHCLIINLRYTAGSLPVSQSVVVWSMKLHRFIWLFGSIGFVFTAWAIARPRIINTKSKPAEQRFGIFLLIWFAGSLLAVIVGRHHLHYILQLYPSLSILSAYGLMRCLSEVEQKRNGKYLKSLFILIIAVNITFVAVKYRGRSLLRYLSWRQPYLTFQTFFQGIGFFLNCHSTKEDTLFVWGFCPQIYVFSDRVSSSRFISCNSITGLLHTRDIPIPGTLEMLMDDLERKEPKFIIDTSAIDYFGYKKHPISNFQSLQSFLNDKYSLYQVIDRVKIYKRITKADTLLVDAQKHFEGGQIERALEKLGNAFKIDPKDSRIPLLLADIFISQDKIEKAIEQLELGLRSRQFFFSSFHIFRKLGICHFKLANFAEAVTNFEEVLKKNPYSLAGHFYLARIYLREQKEYEKALPHCMAVLDLAPESPESEKIRAGLKELGLPVPTPENKSYNP